MYLTDDEMKALRDRNANVSHSDLTAASPFVAYACSS